MQHSRLVQSPDKRKIVGPSPTISTQVDGVIGNISLSKSDVLGSSPSRPALCLSIPIGRGSRLKIGSVWVRIPSQALCPSTRNGIWAGFRFRSLWVQLPPWALTYHFKKFSSRCRYGKPLATVNGSNSAGNKAIEVPQDESVSIGCSASYMGLQFISRIVGLHPAEDGAVPSSSTVSRLMCVPWFLTDVQRMYKEKEMTAR